MATRSERYLGTKLSSDSYHSTELANRLDSGWSCFFKLKDTLCDRRLPLRDRIKLFEASVTPCVLYACGTWTMTVERERRFNVTRRRMLRWMIRTARAHDEDWVTYIKRATHTSEELASSLGSVRWVVLQRKRKWQFAGKAAVQSDGRWSRRLLGWRPWFRCLPRRDIGHPVKRWDDDISSLAGGDWIREAARDKVWQAALSGFIDESGVMWRA